MKVGDRVEVVDADGDVAAWVKSGMVGTITRVYSAGTYRYHVTFDDERGGEDFAAVEIKPCQGLRLHSLCVSTGRALGVNPSLWDSFRSRASVWGSAKTVSAC